MKKIAFLFAGQGAQYPGMGKELYEEIPECRDIFNSADEITGGKISSICFEGTSEELNETMNTQPCVYTVDAAAHAALTAKGVEPYALLGFSLGECAALYAGGAFSFTDGLKLVLKRSDFMREASIENPGGMAAVLGLDDESILNAVREASEFGVIDVVNFNCPGQTVISGEKHALSMAIELITGKGGKCKELNVSGAFHSALMAPAAERFGEALSDFKLKELKTPVISNVTAKEYDAGVAGLMARQIMSPVYFKQGVERLIGMGCGIFVELGPGRVLSNLVRRISRGVTCCNVENVKSLYDTLEIINNSI